MVDYQGHPSKIGTWRDGALHVSPEAERADLVVWFAFHTEEDEPRWEGLLATSSADGHAVVRSVPFFLYDIALGDEVGTVTSSEGALVAAEIRRRSDSYVYRVRFESDDDRWLQLMRDLEPWSCWFDVRSPRFIALATPSEHAQDVADYLARRELAGELQYETGRTR